MAGFSASGVKTQGRPGVASRAVYQTAGGPQLAMARAGGDARRMGGSSQPAGPPLGRRDCALWRGFAAAYAGIFKDRLAIGGIDDKLI